MRTWWQQLAIREKQLVSAGLLCLLLFLFYEILSTQLIDKVNQLRHKVYANQSLLAWMQASNKKIQALEKNNPADPANDSVSLLSLIQNALNDGEINQNTAKLQQAENEAVQLQLQKLNFDTFIQWLTNLCQQQQLLITQLSITPLDEIGTVNVDLKLNRR